jgi:hypothetical protein
MKPARFEFDKVDYINQLSYNSKGHEGGNGDRPAKKEAIFWVKLE